VDTAAVAADTEETATEADAVEAMEVAAAVATEEDATAMEVAMVAAAMARAVDMEVAVVEVAADATSAEKRDTLPANARMPVEVVMAVAATGGEAVVATTHTVVRSVKNTWTGYY